MKTLTLESSKSVVKDFVAKIDFDKQNGLVPAIVQDVNTMEILMLGYQNAESIMKTIELGKVTFFSRSRKAIWIKGETSGNYLNFIQANLDCDNDTILIKANPVGDTCHLGNYSCFDSEKDVNLSFISYLQQFISKRKCEMPEKSYTTKLFNNGVDRMAQKVGEEAVETVIEAKNNNLNLFLNETADLIYHLIVLLTYKETSLFEVQKILKERHFGK